MTRRILRTPVRRTATALVLLAASLPMGLSAQDTGTVTFAELGLSFTIPGGWMGQVAGEGYIMASRTETGFILMSAHEHQTTDAMMAEARSGVSDPMNGVDLRASGEPVRLDDRTVGMMYEGVLGGEQAKVSMVGVLNPHGQGVVVMAATTPANFGERYQALAREVGSSLQFAQPQVQAASGGAGEGEQDWNYLLGGTRLTWMDSYTSIDYSNPDIAIGGGSYDEEVIDLCEEGWFNFRSSSFTSITGGAAVSGTVVGQGKGAGRWEVGQNPAGQPTLVLNFYAGEVKEYVLSYPDREMHLDGYRYYHTWTGENAPACY